MSNSEKIDRLNRVRSGSNAKKKVLRKRGKKNQPKTELSGTENHRILDSFLTNLTLLAPTFGSHSDIISTQNFLERDKQDLKESQSTEFYFKDGPKKALPPIAKKTECKNLQNEKVKRKFYFRI
jgi:hypothetical protein